jgi:glyoxylase-like metal-dependent hydrolase (beta-lactamase superfamily II)/ferredoxin
VKVRRLETNSSGPFYVTTACINCDTCRQLAPTVFQEMGEYSSVVHQPNTAREKLQAQQAVLACPTAAIHTDDKKGLGAVERGFPLKLDEGVYYCGYTSRKSFGGSSYFIRHPQGNWLIDSPRLTPCLAEEFERMGGIRYIFLTHRDDVADAAGYSEHFRAERIIHEAEMDVQPGAEHIISGKAVVDWSADFRIIVTPGHSRGHMVLIYKNTFLFTGDHLAWNREKRELEANKEYCWYSWKAQVESMRQLAHEQFDWVLPGHGDRIHLPKEEMTKAMDSLLQTMLEDA